MGVFHAWYTIFQRFWFILLPKILMSNFVLHIVSCSTTSYSKATGDVEQCHLMSGILVDLQDIGSVCGYQTCPEYLP